MTLSVFTLYNIVQRIKDFDTDNNLIDGKPYENSLVYNIPYKSVTGAKPLGIRFNKVNGFVRIYAGTRYLVSFEPEKHDAVFNRISYVIGVKSGITYVISHYYARIKVDSYDSLPLEKKLTFHNVTVTVNAH